MDPTIFIMIAQTLIQGIPKLIEAIKAGRNPGDIKLEEFISYDALVKIKAANKKADDYIKNG